MQGEATCIKGLGDIALRRSDHEGAWGMTLRRLARLAPDEQERRRLVGSARTAWASIDRPDLTAELDKEFGTRG